MSLTVLPNRGGSLPRLGSTTSSYLSPHPLGSYHSPHPQKQPGRAHTCYRTSRQSRSHMLQCMKAFRFVYACMQARKNHVDRHLQLVSHQTQVSVQLLHGPLDTDGTCIHGSCQSADSADREHNKYLLHDPLTLKCHGEQYHNILKI